MGKEKTGKRIKIFLLLLLALGLISLTGIVTDKAQLYEIGNPVMVAEMSGTTESLPWGYFQFPRLSFDLNGNIICKIANKQDSVSEYEGEYLYFASSDLGKTWEQSEEPQIDCSLLMANGCYFQGAVL